MHQSPDKKYIFLIIGIFIVIFGPLVVIFLPVLVPMTFFFEKYTWFYTTPPSNYVWLTVALVLFLISCILLLVTSISKKSIIMAVILSLVAIFIIVGSSMQYTAMSDEGIKYRTAYTTTVQSYGWSDIEKAKYVEVQPDQKGTSYLEFKIKNGPVIKIIENENVYANRSKISAYLKSNELDLQYEDANDGK